MRNIAILYHCIDLDGTASGFICKAAHELIGNKVTCVGINYGYTDEELSEAIKGADEVYCVDFSLRPDDIVKLHGEGYELTIIDHHADPVEKIRPLYNDGLFNGKLEVGKSGALLSWEYLFGDTEIPWWVLTVNDLDLWTFKDPKTRPISLAMSMETMDVEGFEKAIKKPREVLYAEGLLLEQYAQRIIETAASGAYYMEVQGKKALVCQTVSYLRSELAEYLYNTYECDFVALFNHRKDGFTLSLRSKGGKCPVDAIAREHGGNGHAGAAGCFISSLDYLGTKLDDELIKLSES